MALEDLYQELILDHYKQPRGRGEPAQFDVHVHHSNPLCGDELDLWLGVDDDGNLRVLGFDGDGCSISMASASTMTDANTGRHMDDSLDLVECFREMMHGEELRREEDLGDGIAFTGVAKFPVRVKCALLGWMALRDAITTYQAGRTSNSVTIEE